MLTTTFVLLPAHHPTGNWATPFDAMLTKEDIFNVDDNNKVQRCSIYPEWFWVSVNINNWTSLYACLFWSRHLMFDIFPGCSPDDEYGGHFWFLLRPGNQHVSPPLALQQHLLHAADVAWRHGNTGVDHLPRACHQMAEGDESKVWTNLKSSSISWFLTWKVWHCKKLSCVLVDQLFLSDHNLLFAYFSFYFRRYDVFIPKFSIKTSYTLNDMLISMGMTDMFSDLADLSGISEGQKLAVSDVR